MCPAVPWPAPPPTRLGPPPERGVDATAPPVCGVGMTRQTSPAAAGGREREGEGPAKPVSRRHSELMLVCLPANSGLCAA